MTTPKESVLTPVQIAERQIAEVEDRLRRDWVIRRHHLLPLIAMAKEFNRLSQEAAEKKTA